MCIKQSFVQRVRPSNYWGIARGFDALIGDSPMGDSVSTTFTTVQVRVIFIRRM